MYMKTFDWLKEFNDQFTMGNSDMFWFKGSAGKPKNVKDFITKLIVKIRLQQLQEIREEFERIQDDLDKEYGKGKYDPHYIGVIEKMMDELKV